MNPENISAVNFTNYPTGSLAASPLPISVPPTAPVISVPTSTNALQTSTPGVSTGTLKHDGYIVESKGVISSHSPWIFIIGIVVGIIIILLIVALIFSVFVKENGDFPDINTVIIDDEINDTTGSSADGTVKLNNGIAYQDMASCLAGPTREWTTGQSITFNTCDCLDPFFDSECFRESYSDTYTSIGTPAQTNIIATFSNPQTIDRLSFPFTVNPGRLPDEDELLIPETICTKLCDQDRTCLGVWWIQAEPPLFGIDQPELQKPKCQLISDQVVVKPGTNIPYSSSVDSILYLKKNIDPEFKDRVFVYQGQKPLRYWTADSYSSPFGDNQSQTMFNRQLIKFNWRPEVVINVTGCDLSMNSNCPWGKTWYGFFSNQMINLTDNSLLKELIDISNLGNTNTINIRGQEYVVVRPKQTQLAFPTAWRELWGAFVDPSTIPGIPLSNISVSSDVSITNVTPILNNTIFDSLDVTSRTSSNLKTVNLNTVTFPWTGEGKIIIIRVGDRIEIASTDRNYHDLVSTDSEWFIIGNPINLGVANPFQTTITFSRSGTYHLKDRMNPRIVRLTIQVNR